MKIDISQLLNGAEIINSEFDTNIELDREDITPVGKAHVKLSFLNEDNNVIVKGKISQMIKAICDRCLEPFDYELNTEIDESISFEDNNVVIDHKYIDVDEILRSSLILDIPMKLLCSEECKGLCPVCGINLNKYKCDCQIDDIDPRLEKLKKFFG